MAELIEKEKNKTHMVAGDAKAETENKASAKAESVKIKVLRPIAVGGIVRNPGEVVEVSPEMAAELCQDVKGHHAFRGERHDEDGDAKRFSLQRAKRVTKDD